MVPQRILLASRPRGFEGSCTTERARSACKRINLLRAVGFHRKSLSSFQLINICCTYVYPLADYGTHLVPTCGAPSHGYRELVEALNELDPRVVEYALGCIQKEPQRVRPSEVVVGGRLPRHLKIAKLPNWQHRTGLRLARLARRLHKRATLLRRDLKARADPKHLQVYRSHLGSPTDLSRRVLNRIWNQLCNRRVRKIPIPDKGLLPILYEKDAVIRDSGITYYTGAFWRRREVLRAGLRSTAYEEGKRRLQADMSTKVWSYRLRKRTIEVVRQLVSIEKEHEVAEYSDGIVTCTRRRLTS